MVENVFQVLTYIEWKNFMTGEGNRSCYGHEEDLGIFKTLEAATNFIAEHANNELVKALERGDWAWINARPIEPIDFSDPVEDKYFAKGIMMYSRPNADIDMIDYYVATRIVKESA